MKPIQIRRVIPNERFQLIVEFAHPEYRLFEMAMLTQDATWAKLAYPQHIKNFSVQGDYVSWPIAGKLTASFLYENSRPITPEHLQSQRLRLSYKNQAPTQDDAHHHVYGVYLAPFSEKIFHLEMSIGGGHAERGGGWGLSLAELFAHPDWQSHFKQAGCLWAVALIQSLAQQPQLLLDSLIHEACKRNGLPGEDE